MCSHHFAESSRIHDQILELQPQDCRIRNVSQNLSRIRLTVIASAIWKISRNFCLIRVFTVAWARFDYFTACLRFQIY